MKKYLWRGFCLLILAACLCGQASAAQNTPPVRYLASASAEQDTTVSAQLVGGKWYLFLPSSADLEQLALSFTGGGGGLPRGELRHGPERRALRPHRPV